MSRLEFEATASERLDAFLARVSEKSRSQISKDIKAGYVTVNDKVLDKPSFTLKINDKVVYTPVESKPTGILPPKDKVELDFVYKDDDISIINKPRGMVVHPAPGHHDDTLVNYLFSQDSNFDFDKEDDENLRPGIVHRIDKDTQGLLAVANNLYSQDILQQEIRERLFHRSYLALVYGDVKDKRFKIDAPLTKPNHTDRRAKVDIYNGRDAITHCVRLGTTGKVTLLLCMLETGRTHQIRAHLDYIGYPIVGDPLYGKRVDKVATKGQCLTAFKLSLIHPSTQERMEFYAPIDEYFKKVLRYYFR